MSELKDIRTSRYRADADVPLKRLRVLDLSRLVAGNILTHFLADFGADVIKIERPGRGDDLRHWKVKSISSFWKVYARNKRSITLDYRFDEGRDILLALVKDANILVENFIPGTLEKWDLGPSVLHKYNHQLIIVRISGWGQDGPDKEKPGFGSLVEARTGFASMNGYPDRPPVLPPLALADSVAGLYGAAATMVAVRSVEVSGGKGQIIDLPLFDPLFSILGPEAANYELTGKVTPRFGSRSIITAPRNTYRCRDGLYVALSASMQSMVERLFKAIKRADLINDRRFRTNSDRVKNNDDLDEIIAKFMANLTQAECLQHFESAGVTVGPVQDMEQIINDPMVNSRQVLLHMPDEEMDELPMHNVAAHLSETPGTMRLPAPKLGEHNGEIYREIGIKESQINALRRKGTI